MNSKTLLSNWESLIKKEVGENVKCALKGETQLLVKCDELAQFFVNGFFTVHGKSVEFVKGGLLVDLENA